MIQIRVAANRKEEEDDEVNKKNMYNKTQQPSSCGLSLKQTLRQALGVSMRVSLKFTLADENRNLLSLRMREKIVLQKQVDRAII